MALLIIFNYNVLTLNRRIKEVFYIIINLNAKDIILAMNQNLFLDFKNVEIKQQNKIILNDVNLKINQGEFVYFVGKTGSGKSSLT